LLRVEDDIQIDDRPFLRFHPTLAIASADSRLSEEPETRQRFIHVYLDLMRMLDKALHGSQSRTALVILNREESNYRTAVQWALADQQHQTAATLGHTFHLYLERSGRLRERDAWVKWLRDVLIRVGFTEEAASYERLHAWTLYTGGNPDGAVNKLQALVERLRHTTEFDPALQLAFAISTLGRLLDFSGASAQAIPILRDAIRHWEVLVERAAGQPWAKLLDTSDRAMSAYGLSNLSDSMGDLANALGHSGEYDEALAIAENALKISEKQGNHHSVGTRHAQSARILMDLGRYKEADARYELALTAARQAGDTHLEEVILSNQVDLAVARNQLDRATSILRHALKRFQKAGDKHGVMDTYKQLGVVEGKAGRLAEARAWCEKSRELAVQLQDRNGLGQAAQNIGKICQIEGEAARERNNEPAARKHFEASRRSFEERLGIKQTNVNKPDEALALGQLAFTHFLLGDLDAAERHAHAAREIRESLGLKEAVDDYNTLSEIAQARGDARAATEWAQKRDKLHAEIQRRAGDSGLPAQMLKALQQLAIACAQAGFGGAALDPGTEEALAKLDGSAAPLPDFASHLRHFAAGNLPPVPTSLPAELRQILEQLTQAIREAQGGHG
jgi:tetratricopeptide (TPR) repeat protein